MLPFAFTIFAGAFLLFAVQPLVGKFILPWFGGGPGVWTTCLLFFQVALLGGYVYAHLSATRLSPRRSVLLHVVLLVLALALLPIVPGAHWKPAGSADPIGRILLLLTVCIGAPYFVLSATGPLMQRWFSLANPGRSPWRLYALSNVGSLLALLSYPFYFERYFTRQAQAALWSAALVVFAFGCVVCGLRVWRAASPAAPVGVASGAAAASPILDRILWFALPAVASVLLLATTNELCQNLAVVPFLWVLPLGLYLLSFILCFDHPRWYRRGFFSALFALGALVDVYLLFVAHEARLPQQIAGYTTTLFAACMLCHGEVFQLRPPPARLTSFYLHLAAGGAAGAFLVAVVAPLLFDRFLELQAGLWLLSFFVAALSFRHRNLALAFGPALGAFAALLVIPAFRAAEPAAAPAAYWPQLAGFAGDHRALAALFLVVVLAVFFDRRGWVREWRRRAGNFAMLFSLALGMTLFVQIYQASVKAVVTSRNFYGVLKVFEHNPGDPESHYFELVHGVTSHGLQLASPPRNASPTTYYGNTGGLGRLLERLPDSPPPRIGLVGLGTGTVALYGRAGGIVRIYEIDPQVERFARTRFSYLAHCPARVTVVLGDARLSMERELAENRPQHFDVLALDAFSSDAIPVHLLTAEAFAVYLRELQPDGVIAVHLSNRYVNLRPVVENVSRHLGLHTVVIHDEPTARQWWLLHSTWMLISRDPSRLAAYPLQSVAAPLASSPAIGLWTDDYASVYDILK